jgi:AcrR family transcriptional regulator
VATEAGVAKGTVYLYFDSKEQLLAGLGNRYMQGLVRHAEMLLEEDDSDRLRDLTTALPLVPRNCS